MDRRSTSDESTVWGGRGSETPTNSSGGRRLGKKIRTSLGPKTWASQVATGTKLANRIAYVGLGLTGIDILTNGFNSSNSLDGVFGAVSFGGAVGAAIGGVYFGANLLTQGITGKSIGQHVDERFIIIPTTLPGTPFLVVPRNP
jgi:hypothetical protein